MAGYRMKLTVYKDSAGKTLKGPTAVHFLGDLCSGFGLFGILGAILAVMEDYGAKSVIGAAVLAVAGFTLCVVFHRMARKGAGRQRMAADAPGTGES